MPQVPSFCAGASFFFTVEEHLWFLISNPIIAPDQVLLVNLTTFDDTKSYGSYNDPACRVEPIDHPYPYVTHSSCICYAGALTFRLNDLELHYNRNGIDFKDQASPALLNRIRQSAGDSHYMEPDSFQILVDQELD